MFACEEKALKRSRAIMALSRVGKVSKNPMGVLGRAEREREEEETSGKRNCGYL